MVCPAAPAIDASGLPGVFLAGDWIGPEGLLADAALKSGHDAGPRRGGSVPVTTA